MLRRAQRIGREKFAHVYSKSTAYHSPHILMRVARSDASHCSGAVVVSKRVARGAVGRHRLKRRLYALLKEVFERVSATPSSSFDIILIAKKGAENRSFQELQGELSMLSERFLKA